MNINIKNVYEWPMTTRLLVLGLISAIALYVGYYMDLSSLRASLQEGVQKEEELKQQLNLVIQKKVSLEKTLTQYQTTKTLLIEWQKKFVKHSVLPELLNDILKSGANNSLYFTLFTPEEEKQEGNYEKVPVRMVVVGNYHQIADFLSQIANMSAIVVVGNFILSSENKNDVLGSKLAAQASAQNLLTAEIQLEIYHILEKKPEAPKKDKDNKDKTTGDKPAATPNTPATTPPPLKTEGKGEVV